MTDPPRRGDRVRKSRGKGLRTKSGCLTCRERHVKCDETHPVCRACQKGGRKCQYTTGPTALETSDVNVIDPSPRPQHESDDSTPLSVQPSPTRDASQSTPQQHMPSINEVITAHADETPIDPVFYHTADEGVDSRRGHERFTLPPLEHTALNTVSPASTTSGHLYSAEIAPLRWLDLLTQDSSAFDIIPTQDDDITRQQSGAQTPFPASRTLDHMSGTIEAYNVEGSLQLSATEASLLRHFVDNISPWIDLTDHDAQFSSVVPAMALKNRGLMLAILALSSRHQSLLLVQEGLTQTDRTTAVQYYNETLQYLQIAMGIPEYLKSDELLATVLLISTYEMIDGHESGWERHLKGVFWIQRSQLIHGESGGLKQAIWWAWLRQDIWAAFRSRRIILSYYTLKKECSELDRWGLTNRVVWLLGQCISFGSDAEVEVGRTNVQQRVHRASFLTARLEEWWYYFAPYRIELPTDCPDGSAFRPIWINPPSCSAAVQIYHFARIMLAVHSPAASGLKELERLQQMLSDAVDYIGGIACTTSITPAIIISTQCLFAAGLNTRDIGKREHIVRLIRSHQSLTGWPVHDLTQDLHAEWAMISPATGS